MYISSAFSTKINGFLSFSASSSSPNKNTQPASSKKTEAAKNTVEPTKPKREGEEPKRKGEEPKRKGEEPKSIPAGKRH